MVENQIVKSSNAHDSIIYQTKKTPALDDSGCCLQAEASPPEAKHESCAVWHHIAEQLTSTNAMQQSCQAGQGEPCTRFDCKGAYKYSAAVRLILKMSHSYKSF